MTLLESIGEFRTAAILTTNFAAPATRDYALHMRMAIAFANIAYEGSDGFAAFKALLYDDSPLVRGWVDVQLLSQGNEDVVPVLEQLAFEPTIRGFTAETTLIEFRTGRLRSPFTPTTTNKMPGAPP